VEEIDLNPWTTETWQYHITVIPDPPGTTGQTKAADEVAYGVRVTAAECANTVEFG